MNISIADRKIYTVREVAEMLGVSQSSIRRWHDAGKLAHLSPIKIGSRLLFRARAVDRFISGVAA